MLAYQELRLRRADYNIISTHIYIDLSSRYSHIHSPLCLRPDTIFTRLLIVNCKCAASYSTGVAFMPLTNDHVPA